MKPTIEKPKVFISYAWGTQEYQDRVIALSRDLVSDGIDVLLDKWSLKEGHDTYAYMEQSVTNNDVTNVLILLDPIYAQKADDRTGGVGTETQIISPEIYNNVTQEKFLPVVMERDENGGIPKPAYLRGLLHFDLSNPEQYDAEYQRLVKRLYGIEIIAKPSVGKMPRWVTEDSVIASSTRTAISALKKNNSPTERRIDYIQQLNTLRNKIKVFDSTTDDALELYDEIKPYRDEYLHLLEASPYINDSHILVGDFIQELYYDINTTNDSISCKDTKQLLLHELLIYTVAFYYKCKDYRCLEYILNRTYFGTRYRTDAQEIGLHIFYHHSDIMDYAKSKADDKNYHCGTAQHWIENIATEICNKAEFVFADVLLCNYSVYGKNYNDSWYWFPVSYVYGGEYETPFKKVSSSMRSKEVATNWMRIFGYEEIEEFRQKIISANESIRSNRNLRPRYHSAFHGVQLIGDFIEPKDIATLR